MLHDIDTYPKLYGTRHPKMLSERPTIHPTSRIYKAKIGSWTEIGPNSTIVETTFDDYSYTAGDAQIIYTEVGRFCSIASHVRINPGNHPMDRVTQHHMTYRRAQYGLADTDDGGFFAWRRAAKCVIGHDVWIGHGALIMPGVSVATGAVIGAGAVVTRDVGPYAIAVGVPARVIKHRFSADVVAKLLRIAWWEWDRPTLERRFADLNNLDLFLRKYSVSAPRR